MLVQNRNPKDYLYILITLTQLLLLQTTLAANEAVTQNGVPAASEPAKMKVDVLSSALCRKCKCDAAQQLLDCSNTNITTWFNESDWNTLQNGDINFIEIRLQHNNITDIPIIRSYPVKVLDFSYNQIQTIALGAFQNLTSLEELNLSYNKIRTKLLTTDTFKGPYSPQDTSTLNTLRVLNLAANELHSLNGDLFEHVPLIQTLNLSQNTFQVIDISTETAISSLVYLKALDISYMELNYLPQSFLHAPRDLETLILTGNLFLTVPEHLYLAINLKNLILDENPIVDLNEKNCFPNLRNLETLSISYMPYLKEIGKYALSELQELNTLKATDNPKLAYIDQYAFAKATSNPGIFQRPSIEKIYLHNNNISSLNDDTLDWNSVNVIDIQFNPWDCSCENRWLIKKLILHINNTTPQLTDNVVCSTPKEFKTVKLIELANVEIKCTSTDTIAFACLIVGILILIPLGLCSFALYRRGCCGLRNRRKLSVSYDRANFYDDYNN